MKKRFFGIFCLIAVLCVTVFAVSCNGGESTADFEVAGNAAGFGKNAVVNSATDRKIVYDVNIRIEVKDVTIAKSAVTEKLSALGGYVESLNEGFSDGRCDYSELTLRVPTEKLDEFLASVEANGLVGHKRVNSTDITTSYVSAEARMEALIERRNLLEQLFEESTTTAERLSVINEISSVSSEIKSLELMISGYDSELAFSTVTLDIDRQATVPEVVLGIILGAVPTLLVISGVLVIVIRRRNYKKAKAEQAATV